MNDRESEIQIEFVESPLAVFRDTVDVNGKVVVDVGCGLGANAAALDGLGATVTGVEIDEARIAAAKATHSDTAVSFRLGRAEDLPVDGASVDVLAYFNSFHHVPGAAHAAAFREMARVLKPGGLAYIQEPVAQGAYYNVMRVIDDEAPVYEDVERQLRTGLVDVPVSISKRVRFKIMHQFSKVDEMKASILRVDPRRQLAFDQQENEFRRLFDEHADRTGGGFCFDHHYRITILERD